MGKLPLGWREKMAGIGWRPDDLAALAQQFPGEHPPDSILGVIRTGDGIGELIGASTSHVHDAKRIEKTLVGFTIGGDNSIMARSKIAPANRIRGCLFITATKFIACGLENHEFPFSEILVASGGGRTMAAANYDLQKLGVTEYSYSGDIYISKFELNRQANLNCGYDDLTIAFVVTGKARIGHGIGAIPDAWRQLERLVITKEDF